MRGIVALAAFAPLSFALATETTLDAMLTALHEQTGVPGMSVAVSRYGALVWHGEAGLADIDRGRPVTADTIMRHASVSKAVCSVIAARLIEENALAADTPVGDLLPELPDQYHPLTLRDLMTHTSGLPHYDARDYARGSKRYRNAVAGLELLGDRPLVSAPGEAYLYSTHGFSLASAMLERAVEKTFVELLRETMEEAGLPGSIVLESEAIRIDARTAIYEGSDNGGAREIQREDFSYSWCGAGMESTAVELSIFASTLFGKQSFLGIDSQRMLMEPMTGRHGRVVNGDRWTMTLGLRRSKDLRGDVYLHHAGVTNGARSIVALWPDSGLAVALLSNASWTGRMEDTAMAFAIAALADGTGADCPGPGKLQYSGTFRDATIEGTIHWPGGSGACRAKLRGGNEFAAWLNRFNYGVRDTQTLLMLGSDTWGLITSIGVSILSGDAKQLRGFVGSGSLSLTSSP